MLREPLHERKYNNDFKTPPFALSSSKGEWRGLSAESQYMASSRQWDVSFPWVKGLRRQPKAILSRYPPKDSYSVLCFPAERLCRNSRNHINVMMSKAKHLAFSGCYKVEILRLRLKMTLRYSLEAKVKENFLHFLEELPTRFTADNDNVGGGAQGV